MCINFDLSQVSNDSIFEINLMKFGVKTLSVINISNATFISTINNKSFLIKLNIGV